VCASSESEALKAGLWAIKHDEDQHSDSAVQNINSLDEVPKEWKGCMPWSYSWQECGENTKTVEEIFLKSKNAN
jgi:hypothetical protein